MRAKESQRENKVNPQVQSNQPQREIRYLNWKQYQNLTKDKIIILPVGSTEQHAYHLPLCVDTLLAERFSLQLAERLDAYVAPVISYGYKSQPTSGGGPLFPGTIDLKLNTLVNLVRDILEELLADGWQKIIILNAHFENTAALMEAADLVFRHQKSPYPKAIITAWYDNVTNDVIPQVWDEMPFLGWELEHAAILETSVIMHYAPELVDESLYQDEGLGELPKYALFPPDPTLIPASGTLAPAKTSSAEKGRILVECALRNIESLVKKEFNP